MCRVTMSDTEELPPPRPYTEYNIFFQIERGEYPFLIVYSIAV